MSPGGIGMFYGALDQDTAVAEIGSHGTKRFAIISQFKTRRDIRVLNLAALDPEPSLFDPANRTDEWFDLAFLNAFASDLSKPISVDDREHVDYVPTQIVTEYFRFASEQKVDGILYRGSQNSGICCVLFCDAGGCVDPGSAASRRPIGSPLLEIVPDTVRAVRVISRIA
jgi:hypothetical protein